MNVRLLIEYDGEDFAGWQKQPRHETIQGTLETILRKITKEDTVVYGAGRTDSGVHALGQVATFFTETKKPAKHWKMILNYHLPRTIRILECDEVPQAFSPQKHAISKVYEYRILNRPSPSALHRQALHIPRALNWDKIREAAPHFLGHHDFRSFQGARATVKTTDRTIEHISILDRGDGFYAIRIQANGFLKQMVRAIAGTLIYVGEEKIEPSAIPKMIESKNRKAGGPTAPPHGLFLVKVIYPNWL